MRPLTLHGAESGHLRSKDAYETDNINKYERMDYVPNNPNYSDILHSPYKQGEQYSRTPIDYNMNINAICPLEIDPLSNILPFTGTQAYKDLGVFAGKEKNPQELADVLLSLKHAVVHPAQLGSQLSPLSPSYTMSQPAPQQQYMPNYCPSQYSQFSDSGRNFPEFAPFPSMSVNVSMQMNMNMGMPNQPQFNQWNQQSQFAHAGAGAYSASYSAHNQGYSASYSFSSDIRNLSNEREQRLSDRSKYYTRRQKMNVQRLELTDNSAKMNLCRICGKTYARPSTLKTHMRTHSGEKPYRCTTCSKSFSQAANLTAHIRTHSGEKPFRCMICERRFSQSSSVTTHMRTHSGERPYRCRMCNKAFSDSSTLTKHLRIHSGEKPYKCELCLLRFSQSGNLNRHMRVHANTS